MEPVDQLHPAADAGDGRHGNDDASEPHYAEMMSTRRREGRRRPALRRPYADNAQYAAIDHNMLKQTYIVVVDEP